jgi:hypothetical protein
VRRGRHLRGGQHRLVTLVRLTSPIARFLRPVVAAAVIVVALVRRFVGTVVLAAGFAELGANENAGAEDERAGEQGTDATENDCEDAGSAPPTWPANGRVNGHGWFRSGGRALRWAWRLGHVNKVPIAH